LKNPKGYFEPRMTFQEPTALSSGITINRFRSRPISRLQKASPNPSVCLSRSFRRIRTLQRFAEIRGNLVLVGSFLLARNRSPIVLVLELVLVLGIPEVGAELSKIDNPRPPSRSPRQATIGGVRSEWREDKSCLGWFFVPKGQEESAQGFNPDLYTQFVGGKRSPSAAIDCLEKHRSRCEQNTGWKPMLLYAVAWLPSVRGDSARMSSRDRSTLRKAM
jgi:hypothetical protein